MIKGYVSREKPETQFIAQILDVRSEKDVIRVSARVRNKGKAHDVIGCCDCMIAGKRCNEISYNRSVCLDLAGSNEDTQRSPRIDGGPMDRHSMCMYIG